MLMLLRHRCMMNRSLNLVHLCLLHGRVRLSYPRMGLRLVLWWSANIFWTAMVGLIEIVIGHLIRLLVADTGHL